MTCFYDKLYYSLNWQRPFFIIYPSFFEANTLQKGTYSMRHFLRWCPVLLVLTGTALLLMGAGNQVNSSVTSSAMGSISTSTLTRATGSITNRMTNSVSSCVSSSATISVTIRATAAPVILSASAEELAKTLKFDRKVLIMAKEVTTDRIGRMTGFDSEGYQIIAPGIVVSVPEEKTDRILSSLRRKLLPLKYTPFVVEMNAGLKIEKIGILKGTDQYEILRIMHTNGDDYDISNQDVIDRLKEWEILSPFDIIGADNDWVEIEFRSLPKDMTAFAEEVYDFCPDALDKGPGSIGELAKDIQKTKKLFLWWD
jgi:hypothetical protein